MMLRRNEPIPRLGRVALAIVGMSCALAAAAGSTAMATTGSAPAVPPGYHAVHVKKDGFSIAVPNTWLALDPKSKALAAALNRAAAKNPEVADLLRSTASARSNAEFMAIDASASDFSSVLMVSSLALDRSALSDLAGLENALQQSEGSALKDLRTRATTVGGAPAAEATATMTFNASAGEAVTVYTTSYFVANGHGVLEFDFATPGPGAEDPTVQTMLTSLELASAPAVISAASASRYVDAVCSAVNRWDDKTAIDVSKSLQDLGSGRGSPATIRARVVHVYASEVRATDQLVSSTRSLAPDAVSGVAAKYLHNLQRARDAYRRAEEDAATAPIATKAALGKSLGDIDAALTDTTAGLGDPVDALKTNPALAHAIQSDASCASVLDAWRPSTTSGLKLGECVTNDETRVSCGTPHIGEVTLVTSYPAGPTAAWPGNDVMGAFANQTCTQAFASYMGKNPQDSTRFGIGWFSPIPGSDWNGGDREVVCTVEMADQSKSTGSAKGVAG